MTIQEFCNERRLAQNLTHQEIADSADMPLPTVKSFFSRASKSPSVLTTAKICAVLGVSIDEFYGISKEITPAEKTAQAVAEEMKHQISMQGETITELRRQNKTMRHAIFTLGLVSIILLIWGLYLDMSCVNIGIFREWREALWNV